MKESSEMDTVPLLTPTMETDLLKEPWIFPQPKMNQIKEEEKATSSTWEENFQDLSSWCMETYQGHCDFHIGESPAFKLSGTKYEGNSALSSQEGVLKDLISIADKEKWNIKMDSAETTKYFNTNSHSLQPTPKVISKCEKDGSTAESTTSNTWLRLSKGTTSSTSTSSWNKQITPTVNTSHQPKYQVGDMDVDDACPTSFDSTETQREPWDVLRTVETNGSDSFDLLSYLCDDEIRSPEGSVSTDSSVLSKPWSTADSSPSIPQSYGKVKAKNKSTVQEPVQTRAASTVTSPVAETPVVSSRKSERLRTSVNHKVEKTYNRIAKSEKSGRRRVESNSEDRSFAVHYRESREKNNEASRKSRMNKKAKESEMATKAIELERDNRILKMKVEELEKLVTSMRSALLRSALKKEF